MRRLRSYARRLYRRLAAEAARAKSHPKWTAGVIGAGSLLVWLVMTTTFADAIAEQYPELALSLNGRHPRALVTMAESIREKILHPTRKAAAATATADSGDPNQGTPSDQAVDSTTVQYAAIRAFASHAAASDPLNGRAYRLLGETAAEPDIVRAAMQEALKRSRRETAAALWLMHDSFEREDYADAVAKADLLLRTRPAVAPKVMKYLGAMVSTPEGRAVMASALARNPSWRASFFSTLPNSVHAPGIPLALMLALKERGSPPEPKELAAYLRFLVARRHAAFAYDTWLQFLPPEKADALGLLNNASFKEPLGGTPFDWQLARGTNAIAELQPIPHSDGARALHMTLLSGRVKFPQLSQIVALPPGQYRFEGVIQGAISGKRGIRWQFQCLGMKGPPTQTDMLFGNSRAPQTFELDFEVPNQDDCRAQIIRLIHDARSASEEILAGEISVQELRLTRRDG